MFDPVPSAPNSVCLQTDLSPRRLGQASVGLLHPSQPPRFLFTCIPAKPLLATPRHASLMLFLLAGHLPSPLPSKFYPSFSIMSSCYSLKQRRWHSPDPANKRGSTSLWLDYSYWCISYDLCFIYVSTCLIPPHSIVSSLRAGTVPLIFDSRKAPDTVLCT